MNEGGEAAGRDRREENDENYEHHPCDKPPVIGKDANGPINQFSDDRTEDKADQQPFDLIPNPRAGLLIGEMKAVLKSKAIDIERQADDPGDNSEKDQVEEKRNNVAIVSKTNGDIAQVSGPSAEEEDQQHSEAERRIDEAQAPLETAVLAGLRRVGRYRAGV